MMFEKFTDRARHVVMKAQDQARSHGHDYIGTEHILLGLIQEGQGIGIQALESLDIKPETVRQQVKRSSATANKRHTGISPSPPAARKRSNFRCKSPCI